jgi:hypothetical protein
LQITTELELRGADSTLDPRTGLVKRSSTFVGNGVKAGEDLNEKIASKIERDSGTKSTGLLAWEAGSFGGGGGGTLPGTLRELGTVGGGNSVPPQVIGSSDFRAGSNVIA